MTNARSRPRSIPQGYWHLRRNPAERLPELAEPLTGPSVGVVRDLAVEHGMAAGAGFLEIDEEGRLFNSYAVCLPDGRVHRHRKLHAFEHEAIGSGDYYTVFDTPWGFARASSSAGTTTWWRTSGRPR
ncbi:nitrilase-related carbon-nitrogen hydrolase [Microbispora siamensis]